MIYVIGLQIPTDILKLWPNPAFHSPLQATNACPQREGENETNISGKLAIANTFFPLLTSYFRAFFLPITTTIVFCFLLLRAYHKQLASLQQAIGIAAASCGAAFQAWIFPLYNLLLFNCLSDWWISFLLVWRRTNLVFASKQPEMYWNNWDVVQLLLMKFP